MRKFLVGLMLVCGSAQATFVTGNDLHKDMLDSDVQARMYALGYIIGVADAAFTKSVCPPAGVTQGQVLDMVKNFSTNNPQLRNLPADIMVAISLIEHWPCPKGKKKS